MNNFLTQKTGKAGEDVLLICTAVKTVFGQKHIWLLDPLFELLPQSKGQPKALLNIGFWLWPCLLPFSFCEMMRTVIFSLGRVCSSQFCEHQNYNLCPRSQLLNFLRILLAWDSPADVGTQVHCGAHTPVRECRRRTTYILELRMRSARIQFFFFLKKLKLLFIFCLMYSPSLE